MKEDWKESEKCDRMYIMVRKIYELMRDFSAQMKQKNIGTYAASTAFFLFLSLVPMLVLICTIIPFTPLTEENLVTVVTDITPPVADSLAMRLISEVYDKSAGILSIAAIATLWSAGKGLLALRQGLNAINGEGEKRNYFLARVICSIYTLVMLLMIILSLFVMVFGNRLVDITLHRFPQLQALVEFLMQFRFLFVWGLLTLLFAAIYAYIPDRKLKYREQIPGALFSSVVWSVFSFGFSIYVERPGAYGIYGSLSIIVIIMLWMYFCMYIVMIGAYINRYYHLRELEP